MTSTDPPYREIRAHYDDTHITVYQAYSPAIASAAVRTQNLASSPSFSHTRMTWIKPSWCWMLYRSDYSLKDSNQSRILAITMTHANFEKLLGMAVVTDGHTKLSYGERARGIRVQWDPERGPRLEVKGWRSIQIGISGSISETWTSEWIEAIEDVTEMALGVKRRIEEDGIIGVEKLVAEGLMLEERAYEVSEELRGISKMDDVG